MEEWRDIRDFPGYQVSNEGRIRTHNKVTHTDLRGYRHWKDRIMKLKVDDANNWRVCIWRDGKDYTFLVARLVADAFCGEYRDTKLTVNHKDGNRNNNHADNLEWLTLADNIRHGFENGLYPTQISGYLIDEKGNESYHRSLSEASRFFGHRDGYLGVRLRKGLKIRSVTGENYIFRKN